MENTLKKGIFFGEGPVKSIVEHYMDWVEIEEGQTFCAENVLDPNTPTGASIIVGIDGIKCDGDSDEVKLILSSGLYELPVKTKGKNDKIDIRFASTIHVQGTYGEITEDGVLDILTSEEKEFKNFVEKTLGERDDEYAQRFKEDNRREIGGRGLILLEKVKSEISDNEILYKNNVTPGQLIRVFMELTNKYIDMQNRNDELMERRQKFVDSLSELNASGGKKARKLNNKIANAERDITFNTDVSNFCKKAIETAVLPVLEIQLNN